jgi:hypothetical protein
MGNWHMEGQLNSAGKYMVRLMRGLEQLWDKDYDNEPTSGEVIEDVREGMGA